jgi:NADH:flavin oxidoreductases, Old Yellow Enzyme family
MTHPKYPHVFSPLTIGRQVVKNRIIMGSMHTGLEDGSEPAKRLSAYFVERVKGGVGMIITGGISPHPSGGYGAKLTNAEEVAMHREVTQAVHAADPEVKICMQILHSGPLAGVPGAVAPSPSSRASVGTRRSS